MNFLRITVKSFTVGTEGGREEREKKRLVLNEALLNKPRRHFAVITFN